MGKQTETDNLFSVDVENLEIIEDNGKESIRAKVIKECMRLATGNPIIGTKIQMGELQRKWMEKEPAWHAPDSMRWEEISLNHFTLESLLPDRKGEKIVLQLHGGGYVNPIKNVYRNFAKKYAEMGDGMGVYSPDYRVAPEHTYPAALLDVIASYEYILRQGHLARNIIVAGDSAGGGLAVALCMWLQAHHRELPSKLVLMSPWLDMTASGESYDRNFDKDPMFGGTRESMIYRRDYAGDYDIRDPYLSPLYGDFNGMPEMLIQAGEIEMLRSDAESAAKAMEDVGGKVSLQIYKGMFHVFQMGLEQIPESAKAWEEVEKFILS